MISDNGLIFASASSPSVCSSFSSVIAVANNVVPANVEKKNVVQVMVLKKSNPGEPVCARHQDVFWWICERCEDGTH